MGKQELDNLVQIGKLKAEAPSRKEFDGMLASARRGLVVAQNESIETGAVLPDGSEALDNGTN
jgi:hypothetical protein